MGKFFPSFYDLVMKPLEMLRFKKVRSELVRSAEGSVLEIGSGTGANFPHYSAATDVTAIEPSAKMSERAKPKIEKAHVPIKIYEATAEELPFEDDTFDTVVATLVFCTIPNPQAALQEIQRVCKQGARLLFFEHVRFEQPLLAKGQDLMNPLWNTFSGGCQLNRDTLAEIKKSGIEVTKVEPLYNKLLLSIEGTCHK